ncbi:MAG: PEP-CTERM sorting domain-containing protein, partial [Verrucomicrobiaceae bacterium]
LTFLYAHVYPDIPASNHYHSKGVYRYTGDNLGEGQTAKEVNPANYLPEGTAPPLDLTPATGGLYDGKLISAMQAGNDFSALTIEDTGKLSGFAPGSGESVLFNSSSNRWNGTLTGADVHLQLVSLSAGLNVGSSTTLNLFVNPGDEHHLDESFSFTPLFWTNADAAPGVYIAQFKLTDESGTFGDSGTFEFRFNVVPEPSSVLLGALGALGLLRRRR